MRFRSRVLTTAAASLFLVAAAAAPASANDATVDVHHNGVLKARATWDDGTDNLCIKVFNSTSGAWGWANMYRIDGGWHPPIRPTDTGGDSTQNCTGNMSIPEDVRFRIDLEWYSADGTVVKRDSVDVWS